MKLADILKELEATLLTPEQIDPSLEATGCYCGDLLSNVIAHAKAGNVWVTMQTHQNIIAVAVLLDLHSIVLVEGNQPQEDTLLKAQKEGVALLSTPATAYQVAGRLYAFGLGR